MKTSILSIDVGGSGLKAAVFDAYGRILHERVRVATPHPCPPQVMLEALRTLIAPLPRFNRIAVGFPGVVRDGHVLTAPNLGTEPWVGFPLADTLSQQFGGAPVKLINDAEMQGLALITGVGLELVMTMGTGMGTGLFRDGEVMPHMELAHHPVRKKLTYDEYLGNAALQKIGRKRWNKRLQRALTLVDVLLHPDRIFIGGGNATRIDLTLPANVSIGSNEAGLEGGAILWRNAQPAATPKPAPVAVKRAVAKR